MCSGVLLPNSINDLAKVGYNLAKVKPFGKTSYDLAKVKQSGKTLYNLAKSDSFAKLYRVLPKSIGGRQIVYERIDKKIMGK